MAKRTKKPAKRAERVVATLNLTRWRRMTATQRAGVTLWLRMTASTLEHAPDMYANRFRARYYL